MCVCRFARALEVVRKWSGRIKFHAMTQERVYSLLGLDIGYDENENAATIIYF